MPHANHYVYLSNEADVLREMKAFINGWFAFSNLRMLQLR